MENQQLAYDLSYFEKSKPETETQTLRVSENPNKIAFKKFLHNMKIVLMAFMVVTVATLMLTTQATNNSLLGEISKSEAILAEEQATGDFLEDQLSENMSVQEISAYAEQELGLIKMVKAQVNYITLDNENEIEVKQQSLASVFDSISAGFMNIMEYMTP